jgi:hypothetical protein
MEREMQCFIENFVVMKTSFSYLIVTRKCSILASFTRGPMLLWKKLKLKKQT